MNKRILSILLAGMLLLSTFAGLPALAEAGGNPFIQELHALLDEVPMEYRPWTRWWMAEGLHTDETIINDMKQLYEMGIGGVEIVCMPEPNVDNDAISPIDQTTGEPISSRSLYSWGSEEWAHDTELVIREATKYGMGFSMTSGTHWSNANLPESELVPDDDGAGKSLGYAIQTITAGETFDGVLQRSFKDGYGVNRQDLVAVVAMKRDSSSDAIIITEGEEAGTIENSQNTKFMVYDDSATHVLTDLVTRDGVVVTEETLQDPTGAAEFMLSWTAPDDGTWDIYSFWLQATGQSPTPSATRNFTVNYIDPYGMEEFIKYYEENFFTPELKEIVRENGKGEMYMDSIEISTQNGSTGQFWGYTLMDEFEKLHGYDLTPYLPYIIRHNGRSHWTAYPTKMLGSDGVKEEKIHHDLYSTMTEMYINNVLLPLKTYLNEELNMKLRAEITYNLPYEFTTPAIGVDYVETESLDFSAQIESFRVLAGAAHVYGRRYSSETGARFNYNYVLGQEDYMDIINTQFAAGISHSVLHGFSSIEGADAREGAGEWDGTYWPGHEGMYGMFSERWGERQPASLHYDDLMSMIGRNQAVLQQGKPQVDIAILRTDYYNSRYYYANHDPMRERQTLYMKDLALQDAGYTYEYFAPENLEKLEQEGIVDYREGEGLIPDNVGYQAVIFYQDSINVESAEKLLDLAQKGLPVIIVNGLTERYLNGYYTHYGQYQSGSYQASINKTYDQAAVYTLGNDDREAELAEVMEQLKRLENVIELTPEDIPDNPNYPHPDAIGYEDIYVTGKTGILEALQELGVEPRAKFAEPSQNFLTFTRRTDDKVFVWVYNFITDAEEADTISLSISEAGKPYAIDAWTTEITELGAYTIEDGRTNFDVTLDPGATTIIALDLNDTGDGLHAVSSDADKVLLENDVVSVIATESGSYTTALSDGTTIVSEIVAPENIELKEWNLTVESWTAGEKEYITEDRGLGYETTEVRWNTAKTPIEVGTTELVSWIDIPEVGCEVSGVGTYTTCFALPEDWSEANGAYLDVESIGGNTAAVFVNGQKAPGFDIIARTVDVSDLLQPGENTITIEVSTTLRNRLIAMGYSRMEAAHTMPADYGMMGDVALVTYTIAEAK